MTGLLSRIPFPSFGSLKLRIAVLYAVLFSAVLAIVIMAVSAGIERFGEDTANRDLAANARVFDEIIDLRAQQMRSSADVLSRDFGFREAVATDDRLTISSALRSLRNRSGASAAFVVGLDASYVGDGASAQPDVASIWDPLDHGREQGIIRLGDTLALAAASPIEAPDIVGWLVIAQPLDAAEMARLNSLAAIEMDATVQGLSQLPERFADRPTNEVFEGDEAGRNLYHLSALSSLEDGVEPRLVLRHSLGEALAEYASLKYLLVAIALAGLALVVALGWRIARSITSPLSTLDKAVRRFGRGEDITLDIRTDDEVGRLAASFTEMVDAIGERERQIIHVGLHDGLTDLPNRKLFVEQLEQALSRRKGSERVMVAYCDLDDFKVVNDTLGHPAGDGMLRTVATALKDGLPDAQIARLGGDEFAILKTVDDSSIDLLPLARKVSDCFDRSIKIEGHTVECSASIGIAVAPGDGEDGISLLKHADLALYRAKRGGKSDFHFFEPSLDEEARRRRQMEADLRLAIKEGHFELYFQPLYSLTQERLQGFEALIRWNHPSQGLISPAEFIPLAEETGLILQIGDWVVREACSAATSWPDELSVAINISPKQFATPGLSTTILQALSRAGLAPERLELEITENVFIADIDRTLGTLHGLRDLGVRIALDDFGTGYSSLSYLRSFPFDKVKIDQSFVRDLCDHTNNAHAVIRAITTLAEALGMDTLAEGVEFPEQRDILKREGCEYIQGYLLSKPVPHYAVAELIGRTDIAQLASKVA